MHDIHELGELLPYSKTKQQKQIIQALINNRGCETTTLKYLGDTYSSAIVRGALETLRYHRDNTIVTKPAVVIPQLEFPRVLAIDIETSPTKAYTWNMWNANIGNDMVEEHSFVMCYCAKWLDTGEIIYNETRTEDDSGLAKEMIALLDDAHFVIAHNGARFDMPRINTAAIIHGVKPPSPYRVIDTLRIARKHFKFERNTLEHLADILGCSPKKTNRKFNGFKLWDECLKGNEEAWAEMQEYNIQDVDTLIEVYMKLRPYHKEHPNMGAIVEHYDPICSKCASTELVKNGYTYTDVSKFELFTCMDCGGHSRGRTSHIPKELRKTLITTVRG